jgi:ribosome-associated toxin RatA of RatAB toxin-antitoxin module
VALIESRLTINADAQTVFAAAQEVERFPEVMPDLNSVAVLEDDGQGNTVTKWDGTVAVGPLKRSISWTERDRWDSENLLCTFELIEGDMKKYSGTWAFSSNHSGCLVELTVDFELGIPMLGPLVNNIVEKIMQDNCDALLAALDHMATSQPA